KMKPFTYVNSGGTRIEALAVLLTNGNLYRCNITAGTTALFATGVSDFAVHTVATLLSGTTRIYASIGVVGSGVPPGTLGGELRKINPDNGASATVFGPLIGSRNQVVAVTTDSDMFYDLAGPSVGKNIYITETVINCDSGPCVVVDTRIWRRPFPMDDSAD